MNNVTDIELYLTKNSAEILEISTTSITPNTPLQDVGMTSFYAVLLCGMIEDEYDIEVEPALMFEHETISAVAQAVMQMIKEQKT